ncbi:MAG TPA: ABC transporter ATP-binding protein [Pyrinomonadaceae bacterium]|nr:ABC transporter ATP-binding protein [Pyrinomonadaceae bacterium]
MTTTDTCLQTENLTKRFGARTAVDRLTMRVEWGDIYGFLGPNGAGKSTTLRMLLGLIRPTSGVIKFPARESSWEYMRARSRIGAIVETPAFYDNFSGRRNLQLLASLSGGVDAKRVDEVLDIVGLRERGRDPVRVYSYGMRQRLGIAQALLPTPELIILDEPTNGLDPQGIQETRQLIRRLRDEFRLTILLSSHLLTEVEQVCNRVGIIHEGRSLYEGAPEELLAPASRFNVRVDDSSAAAAVLTKELGIPVNKNGAGLLRIDTDPDRIPALNAALVAHEINVYELTPIKETLEEAFLRLIENGPSSASQTSLEKS